MGELGEQGDGCEIEIGCTSGLLRNKTRLLTVQIKASKETFLLTDALSKHSAFPSIDSFLESNLRVLLEEYLKKAADVISRASERGRKKQSHK